MSRKLKIYIVDDHSLFREGLKFLLDTCENISEVREAANGRDFLNNVGSFIPDVVLMDIEMPEMNGAEATRIVLSQYPDMKIIALSMHSEESFYSEMIEAGAKGFLIKNSQFQDVQKAIHEVADNKNYFSPEILSSIIISLNRRAVQPVNSELTKRELEVLLNICQGSSNQEISEHLYISKRTVDKHRENILLKTCSRNTAELVVYAIKNGYFEI
jgi:DNA-binding NarL/FixJ family response regulator